MNNISFAAIRLKLKILQNKFEAVLEETNLSHAEKVERWHKFTEVLVYISDNIQKDFE